MIERTKSNKAVTEKELKSVIWKLNHASHIIREGQYFLSRLRYKLAKKLKRKLVQMSINDAKDLDLWKKFINKLQKEGWSINHMTLTIPKILCKSDTCYVELGRFTSEGIAWRFWIPIEYQCWVLINVLEFIAVRVTIWIALDSIGLDSNENSIKIFAHQITQVRLGGCTVKLFTVIIVWSRRWLQGNSAKI